MAFYELYTNYEPASLNVCNHGSFDFEFKQMINEFDLFMNSYKEKS